MGSLERSDLPPPVAAQAIYLGLAAPDGAWVRAGVRALSALSAPDPHARIALATGQLSQGAPDAALATLADLDGTDAALLTGRALWALGRRDEARSQLQTALESDIWNPHLWRVLAAWDAQEDARRGQARVMAFLARPPVEALLRLPPEPVDRPGAWLAPEPWPIGDLSPEASAALAVATAPPGSPTDLDALSAGGAGDSVLAGWLAARRGEPGPWVEPLRGAGPVARLSAAWALRHHDPAAARALLDPAATDLASVVIRAETALAGDSAAAAPGDGGDEEIARLLSDSPGLAGLLRERYLVGVQRRAPVGVKR